MENGKSWAQIAQEHAVNVQNLAQREQEERAVCMSNHPAGKGRNA